MAVLGTVLFCDDIRFETSGKMLFIGVYPEDLVPGILPQTLSLSIWARLQGVDSGTHELKFSVGANGATQVDASMPMVVPEGKTSANVSLVGLPIELKDYGSIFITLSGFPDGSKVHAELPVVPNPAARA